MANLHVGEKKNKVLTNCKVYCQHLTLEEESSIFNICERSFFLLVFVFHPVFPSCIKVHTLFIMFVVKYYCIDLFSFASNSCSPERWKHNNNHESYIKNITKLIISSFKWMIIHIKTNTLNIGQEKTSFILIIITEKYMK